MEIHKVFTRTYVRAEQLESAIHFYETLQSVKCGLRFEREDNGLQSAVIGLVHVVAGAESGKYPFLQTRATFLVDRVDHFLDSLLENGAEVLEEPQRNPQGHTMHVRHPDGMVVEYVDGETE